MKKLWFLTILTCLFSCGQHRHLHHADGENGTNGSNGTNGVSTGVDIQDLSPSLACPNGGLSLSTFRDMNDDGYLDLEESVLKVKVLCHGLDGADGSDGVSASVSIESVPAGLQCPAGGTKFTSSTSLNVAVVCNGVSGANGSQGLAGLQGIPGIQGPAGPQGPSGTNGQNGSNGQNGTVVLPVKFCSSDNSTFPEYGLLVGNDLFAVYWGVTPASPLVKQAFLAKLVPGSYQSTGGNNCHFTLN